jgi:zinc transporter 1/2/3
LSTFQSFSDNNSDRLSLPTKPGKMSECPTDNDFDGRMGVRVSAIFVILIGSFLGTWFPVYAARHRGIGVPGWAFFVAKYFGSGVILATAFIHVRGLFSSHECIKLTW